MRLYDSAAVMLYGKERKSRFVPLMRATASLVGGYVKEAYPNAGSAGLKLRSQTCTHIPSIECEDP